MHGSSPNKQFSHTRVTARSHATESLSPLTSKHPDSLKASLCLCSLCDAVGTDRAPPHEKTTSHPTDHRSKLLAKPRFRRSLSYLQCEGQQKRLSLSTLPKPQPTMSRMQRDPEIRQTYAIEGQASQGLKLGEGIHELSIRLEGHLPTY